MSQLGAACSASVAAVDACMSLASGGSGVNASSSATATLSALASDTSALENLSECVPAWQPDITLPSLSARVELEELEEAATEEQRMPIHCLPPPAKRSRRSDVAPPDLDADQGAYPLFDFDVDPLDTQVDTERIADEGANSLQSSAALPRRAPHVSRDDDDSSPPSPVDPLETELADPPS